jgi:transposase InsO family protein
MTFCFIAENATQWPVRVQCRVLGVTVRGFQMWRRREAKLEAGEVSPRQQERYRLLLHIRAAHKQGRLVYGSPRVHRLLRAQGIRTSRKHVASLMRQDGLSGAQRRRRGPLTTQSQHSHGIANNLLDRKFSPDEIGGVDRVWCSDITYLPAPQGFYYLAVVLDAHSRRIVGWELGHSLEAQLVVDALGKALKTRGETGGTSLPVGSDATVVKARLFHSDRGSQFAGRLCSEQLIANGLTASMSRKGNCWDNALVESFFGSLKSELVDRLPEQCFESIEDAWRLLADYIDNFYNSVRLHSTLGYVSPVAFELANRA